MSDDELRARLARLAEAGADHVQTGEGRAPGLVIVHAARGPDWVLRALLHMIDDTVLGTRLVVTSQTGVALSLLVGGRRLRRLDTADAALAPGDLPGQMLSSEETDAAEALAALLRRFAEGARGAITATEEAAAAGESGGLAVPHLASLLALPEPDDHLPPPERFTARAGGRIKACLTLAGGPEAPGEIAGIADFEDPMQALATTVWPVLSDLPGRGDGAGLTLWLRQTGPVDGVAFGLAHWPGLGDSGAPLMQVIAFQTGDAPALRAIFAHLDSPA